MNTWKLYDEPSLVVPFTLKGYGGQVAVFYGAVDDPVRAGFDSLPGISFPIGLCRGYPMMHARVESYGGSGYRALCGWLQVVTRHCVRSAGEMAASRHLETSVDIPPSMQPFKVPFAGYGITPQIYDAPCRNLGDNYELKWVADTFLTTVPIRSSSETIRRLLGFRWGYREYDTSAAKPVTLLVPEATGPDVWNGHLSVMQRDFPDWVFGRA